MLADYQWLSFPAQHPPGKVPRKLLLHRYSFSKSIKRVLDFISQQPGKSGEELKKQLDMGVSTSLLACQSGTQAQNGSSMAM